MSKREIHINYMVEIVFWLILTALLSPNFVMMAYSRDIIYNPESTVLKVSLCLVPVLALFIWPIVHVGFKKMIRFAYV